MFDIWKHANEITNNLAQGLYILEFQYGGTSFSEIPETIVKTAISDAWQLVIEQAQKGNVNLTEEYLSSFIRDKLRRDRNCQARLAILRSTVTSDIQRSNTLALSIEFFDI
ncbi:hypothetical protein [Chamaesiphon minutus]|uniref:Uncharacterized protein n=1 Tax=Chamaesiphon minutus (strain ATCC 27169 / PCC 6605) TaxID=1173020 RepID=K9UCF7_CHAP6|nr:hypothetical protein [Chamaesiphon minutus]AFY92303.1 hypothetical protein Cha6605_1070 [Chamaesiphon minutus PCC 6605]